MREGRRVLLAPKVWGLLALLLAFNLVLAVTQDWRTGAYYDEYQSALRACQALSTEEAMESVETELSAFQALSLLEWYESEEDPELKEHLRQQLEDSFGADFERRIRESAGSEDEERSAIRMEVLQTLQEQLQYIRDYPDYLLQVQDNAEMMKTWEIFNKEGGFSSRNIEKTAADFPTSVELRLDNDYAVTDLVTDTVGSYSLLVFTLFLTLQFLIERKRGLWSLIHGAPEGRGRLAYKRGAILLLGVVIGTLVLLGGKLLFVALRSGGLGSLTRNVQSTMVFSDFPWVMPVWVFLIGFFLLKILGMWLVGMAVWTILQSVNHLPLALCAAGIALAGEYALFRFIPDSYTIAIFRYVNLFALVDVTSIALHYLNLNLFGWPVQGFLLSIGLIPPVLALLFGANVLLTARKKPVSRQNSLLALADRIRVPFSRFVNRLRLFGMELYKILWLQKGVLIVLLAAAFSFGVLEMQPPDEELYDTELSWISASMAGPITEQTLEEIDAKIEEYSAYPPSEMIQRQLEIYERLRDKCVESLEAKDGRWLIDSQPVAALMGIHRNSYGYRNYQRQIAVVLLLALVLLLSGIFSQEHQSRVTQLLQGTPRGGAVLWRKKLAVTILLTTLVWLVFEAGELWHLTNEYGSVALAAPVQSFDYFAELPQKVSLGVAVAVYLLLRLLTMLAAAGVILLISCFCRQNNLALLAACAVLVLPACLSYMRIDILDFVCLSRLFSPLEAEPAGYITAAVIGCGAAVLSRIRWLSRRNIRNRN